MLTGSAVPADVSKINHSGAGRFGWLTMRPMSLWESGESTGDVSLSQLFSDDSAVDGSSNISLEQMAFLVSRGGWPKSLQKKSEKAALAQVSEYYQAIIRSDISRVDSVNRNFERAHRLMRSYARHQGTQASISVIKADLAANEANEMSDVTIESYLGALRKIFVIEDVLAWNPNLRSKTAIRTADTRYFVDPSVAVAALGIGPADLMADLNTFGLLFETLCVRDLHVYADALGGNVYHYRDGNGLECDAVVHLLLAGQDHRRVHTVKNKDNHCFNILAFRFHRDNVQQTDPLFTDCVRTGICNPCILCGIWNPQDYHFRAGQGNH